MQVYLELMEWIMSLDDEQLWRVRSFVLKILVEEHRKVPLQ